VTCEEWKKKKLFVFNKKCAKTENKEQTEIQKENSRKRKEDKKRKAYSPSELDDFHILEFFFSGVNSSSTISSTLLIEQALEPDRRLVTTTDICRPDEILSRMEHAETADTSKSKRMEASAC